MDEVLKEIQERRIDHHDMVNIRIPGANNIAKEEELGTRIREKNGRLKRNREGSLL